MAKVEDKNGFWFIEHNPITKTGVYDYLGKQISPECEPNKIYKVLRPKEELFKKETLDSLRLIPIVNDHTMIGQGFTAPEDKGIDGTLGDNVSHDTDTIYNDLKIMSNKMKEDIRNGKKELSLGYFCRYDKQPGTYKGQRYDYIQRDIKANHLALVDKGRMGADVRVYDSKNQGGTFAMDSIDITMDKDEDIEWITVRGTHIPIKKGESKEQAVKKFLEGKKGTESKGVKGGSEKLFHKGEIVTPEQSEAQFKEDDFVKTPAGVGKISQIVRGKLSDTPYYKVTFEDGKTKTFLEEEIQPDTKKAESKGESEKKENTPKLKIGDRVGFEEPQGVEYKFIGENRGQLQFENIDDDSDKVEFPAEALANKLRNKEIQIFGKQSEPEKTESGAEKKNETEIEKAHEKAYIDAVKNLLKKHKREREYMKMSNQNTEHKDKTIEYWEKVLKDHTTGSGSKDTLKSGKYEISVDPSKMQFKVKDTQTGKIKKIDASDNDGLWSYLEENGIEDLPSIEELNDLAEAKLTTKNRSKESIKIYAANKGFFDDRIKKPQEFKKSLNDTFEEIYADATGIRYGNEKGKTASFKDIYEEAVKRYLNKGSKGQDSTNTEEYKNTQGEDKMAELKKEKPVLDEDKRKIIDEIGGILKGKVDEELWKTIIGKAEKLAYNASEAGKGTDEGEEVEEVIEEEGKEKEVKDKKKAAKDKCGKDKEEEVVEVKKEKEEEKGMDEGKIVQMIARKDKLAKAVEKVIGTFDHSEMTEQQVAEYACDKLDLPVKKGEEITGIHCFLKSQPKEKVLFSYGMDSKSVTDEEFEKFQSKGE